MTGLKLAVLGAVAGALSSLVGDTASKVAVLAAGAAGAGYLFKHILWPVVQVIRRAAATYAVLEALEPVAKSLPDWMAGVDQRLGGLEHTSSTAAESATATARDLGVKHRPADPPGPPQI